MERTFVECTAFHGRVLIGERGVPERVVQVNYGEPGVVESLSAAERSRAGASEVGELGKVDVVEASCERVVGVVPMES